MGRRQASFSYGFDAPPEAIWPFVADTERGNAVAGMPKVAYREEKGADGATRLFGRYRDGLTFDYEERPFTWTYARWHRSVRVFRKGPVRYQEVFVTLEPDGEGGSRLHWRIDLETAGWVPGFLAGLILQRQILPGFRRMMAAAAEAHARREEADARQALPAGLERPPEPADAATRRRIAEAVVRTRERTDSPYLENLAETLAERPPGDLHRLRPKALARRWRAPVQEILDLMLAATDAGLLILRWDVLCPHCRGDRQNLERLDEVAAEAYCGACDLSFDVDLSRNLEVVFAPHPAVRETEPERFCLAGPGSNAHILTRRLLPAGAEEEIDLDLPPGRYRVRVDGVSNHRWLELSAGSAAQSPADWRLCIEGDEIAGGDHAAASGGEAKLRVENRSEGDRIVAIETAEWIQDVLSAGELVVTQRFRDLFDSQVLAPGITLQVERVVVVFTDLVGSTAMYRRLGDAVAFRYVWSHFDALRPVIAAHGGAVVKTIGDAVMAVFPEPASAIRAAAELHEVLDAHDRDSGFVPPVGLKVGLASGPAYAVNLNGLIDYFGSTVNLAARIQAESEGGDVVVPADLAEAVQAALGERWDAEAMQVQAKGFEAPVPALRLRRAQAGARGDAGRAAGGGTRQG
jgi:class 3 adenylate cyclase